jgi:hypothetical protein
MSASPNTTSVYPTRTMPGSFEKFEEEVEHDPQAKSTTETPYMAKSTQANQAPTWDNIRAAFFSWLTLAGYVVFPGTFTSLKTSQTLAGSTGGRIIQYTLKKGLLAIAGACCLFGTVGTSWLWYKWRNNAIWLVGNIFL